MLQLLKGLVGDIHFSDKVLVKINYKPYLLVTRLSCSKVLFSYVVTTMLFRLVFLLHLQDNHLTALHY